MKLNKSSNYFLRSATLGRSNFDEDSDVSDERYRIQNENGFILRIENLTKYFRKTFEENLAAVNGVTVGIKSGEVSLK